MANQNIKIGIIGVNSVGKSSLIARFTKDQFNEEYRKTIGLDFQSKMIDINAEKLNIQLWDAAQPPTRALSFLKSCSAFLFIFSVDDLNSFSELDNFREFLGTQPTKDLPLFIFANKVDLEQPQIDSSVYKEWSQKNNIEIHEVSAKQNINVTESFNKIISQLFNVKLKERSVTVAPPVEQTSGFFTSNKLKLLGLAFIFIVLLITFF
eukprot:TRINITY_DN1263_c3_g1_i1.p1 TRINITY_DN1263_c3_g1~~TRINITY_DN1263_c3_g1_i1.p1  ORF type:complete len:224 (-),score=81.84 TRINITY_DN1263_c3_g1_i1:73-696(-)